jgi:hypothetical protein
MQNMQYMEYVRRSKSILILQTFANCPYYYLPSVHNIFSKKHLLYIKVCVVMDMNYGFEYVSYVCTIISN